MPNYLTKREGTYYFRRVVPPEFRSIIGKREFYWSLRTKNLAEAKRARNLAATKTDRELQHAALLAAESGQKPASADKLSNDDIAIRRDAARIAKNFREYLKEAANDGRYEAARQELADTRQIHDDNIETGWLVDQVPLAQSERYSLALQAVLEPDAAPLLPAITSPKRGEVLRLDALIDLWAAANQPSEKSIGMWRRTVRTFVGLRGDRALTDFSKADILAFVDHLAEEGYKAATIESRAYHLKSLFRFALGRDFISVDPTAGVKPPANKTKEKERYPWTLDALRMLFESDVFLGGEVSEGGKGEAAYFLPLLGLFTGARVNELAQLRTSDVYEETYVDENGKERSCWVMRFVRDKQDGLKLKNNAAVRRIPVHPELARLGFIDHVVAAKARGEHRVFSRLQPDRYGTMASSWGKWFGRYIREQCQITDKRITFHSFRHGFKERCRALNFPEDAHDAITGHTNGSVGRTYKGLHHPLNPMVKVMEGYKVYGLELPRPYKECQHRL